MASASCFTVPSPSTAPSAALPSVEIAYAPRNPAEVMSNKASLTYDRLRPDRELTEITPSSSFFISFVVMPTRNCTFVRAASIANTY